MTDGKWIALAILVVGFAYIFLVARPANLIDECSALGKPYDVAECLHAGGFLAYREELEKM
jgi:hypothetical protein